jgi:hypothetical protein
MLHDPERKIECDGIIGNKPCAVHKMLSMTQIGEGWVFNEKARRAVEGWLFTGDKYYCPNCKGAALVDLVPDCLKEKANG